MPHSKLNTPAWTTLANTMIARLRRHHGMPPYHDNESPNSELELLFAKLESGDDIIPLGKVPRSPSGYIPARQVLIAIRLAATFGSSKVVEQSLHCGALTVVRDITVADLSTITDVLKICFGEAKWQILAPETTDGGLAKSAQSRLSALITESFDLIESIRVYREFAACPAFPRHADLSEPLYFLQPQPPKLHWNRSKSHGLNPNSHVVNQLKSSAAPSSSALIPDP